MTSRGLADLVGEVRLRGTRSLATKAIYAAADTAGLTALRLPRLPVNPDLVLDWIRPVGISTGDLGLERLSEMMDLPGRPALLRGARSEGPAPPVAEPEELVAEAERICKGTVVVFGQSMLIERCGSDADVGAERHWSRIRYRGWPGGDIKEVWELSRMEHLVTLARAWRLTGDERFVRQCCSLVEKWMQANPPEGGVNWISSLEIGVRAINLRWMHEILAPSTGYDWPSRSLVHFHSLVAARHIFRRLNFTRRTGRNNHLIGDAACLTVLGALYPEATEAGRWFDRGLRTLVKALGEQVLTDGMHFERSFGYHLLVTELSLTALLACDSAGRQVPEALVRHTESLLSVVAGSLLPDGGLPDVNDNDDGTAIPVRVGAGPRARSVLEVGSDVFHRAEWTKLVTPDCCEAAGWLVGPRTVHLADSRLPKSELQLDLALDDAGYFLSRTSRDKTADVLLFDSHRDPFPASGHDHASLMQVLLWMGGREVFVDGGTYRYNGDLVRRNCLRSSEAHNTIEVDGLPHAVARGNFGWAQRKSSAPIERTRLGDVLVLSSAHSCYRRLDDPVRHRRMVVWDRRRRCLLVIDRLDSQGQHSYVQRWHVEAQEPGVTPIHGRLGVVARGMPIACVALLDQGDDDIQIHTGDPQYPASFRSLAYGTLEPRTTLIRAWSAHGDCQKATLVTAVELDDDETSEVVERLTTAAQHGGTTRNGA